MIDTVRVFSMLILLSVVSLCAWVQVNEMDGGFLKFVLNIVTFPLGLVGGIYIMLFGFITSTKFPEPMTIYAFLPHIYGWAGIVLLLWSPQILRAMYLLAGGILDGGATTYGSAIELRKQPSKKDTGREQLLAGLEESRNEFQRLQTQPKEVEKKRTDDGEKVLCSRCMGMGRIDCSECDGNGFVPSPRDSGRNIDCCECDGEGDFPCGFCGESGYAFSD